MDRIQRDNTVISDTAQVWKQLQEYLTNTGQPTNILTKLYTRAARAITPSHYCPYRSKIHPRYKGNLMSTEEIGITLEYMNERYSDTMGTLVKFKVGYGPFKQYMFNDTIRVV